jgi:hypothetical protein
MHRKIDIAPRAPRRDREATYNFRRAFLDRTRARA